MSCGIIQAEITVLEAIAIHQLLVREMLCENICCG